VVTIDKEVMHGTPCFAHMRVPVQTLIDFPEPGESIDDFLAVYPSIPRQHVFSFPELSRDIAVHNDFVWEAEGKEKVFYEVPIRLDAVEEMAGRPQVTPVRCPTLALRCTRFEARSGYDTRQ
jgi:uncharacterized protein (DUF433 family)